MTDKDKGIVEPFTPWQELLKVVLLHHQEMLITMRQVDGEQINQSGIQKNADNA